MDPATYQTAYRARRTRKYETTEAIREVMFFGSVGGACRHHKADFVTVPPSSEQDHFDRHIVLAAGLVGLKVKIKEGNDESS